LWHRTRRSRLATGRKGFSSIIGAIFMVLIVWILASSYFIYTLSQNTIYNEAVRARNQEEADRRNENVVALSGNYSVLGSEVTVNVVLKNVGSVTVQIINLWVLDSDPSNRKYTHKSLNLNLKPGDVLNLVGSSGLKVTIPGADPSHNFTSWFVTAKGNTIPLEKEQGVIVAQLAQGIGSIAIDFYTFRYFTYNDSKLWNYPDGYPNFTVPYSPDIAFGVYLTNLDPQKQTIVLNKFSQLWIYFPKSPGTNPQWYVVNVALDGSVNSTYTNISLGYGESKLLIFASSTEGTFSKQSIGAQVKGLPCAVNLLLLGKIGTRDYGQNIPFVSLCVNP
jgi:archaellum component FlaF (FlaF/FlaG flagellin family)